MLRNILYTSIAVSTIGLQACGGGSSSNTAPTVSSTTPADAATAVARNSSITATFDTDIFAITVDGTSFTLANPSAGNTAGSVTFDGASNIASFVPSNTLAILAPYTATLSTAITDLSGNALAANYNWSFTTADGAWGSAEVIDNTNLTAYTPQVAFDNNGNAIAVWSQTDGTLRNIYASRFDGTSWGTPELIEMNNAIGAHARDPLIAFDDNGNAIAVWRQTDGSGDSIWANRFDGTSWGTAELIETDNSGDDAGELQIAVDNNGNAIAVWSIEDNSIWSNHFNGTSWGTAELIAVTTADGYNPQIAVDNNGNAIAVWSQYDGSEDSIWANRFDGTSWGTAVLIETDNTGGTDAPDIAFDHNGNAIAVWRQNIGGFTSILANRFDGTSWGTPELIETDDGTARPPKVRFGSNDNAVAVWRQHDGTRYNIWSNHFNGTSWGTAVLIETNNSGGADNPQIAFDNNGNAIAVWGQVAAVGEQLSIYVNRFNGSSWGTAELLETDAENAHSEQIAFDNNGKAAAVWIQDDGVGISVSTNRFE